MTKLWKTSGLFDHLVVANLTLLVIGMVLRLLHLPEGMDHTLGFVTQLLAAVAAVLLVVQFTRTLQSFATLLRGPQHELVWSAMPVIADDTNGHLGRARHWLRRGKSDESVREVFGETIQQQARRMNDADDAQR